MAATATDAIEPRSDPSAGLKLGPRMRCFAASVAWRRPAFSYLAGLLLLELDRGSDPFCAAKDSDSLTETPWNPGGAAPIYGGLALIYGTLITSAIALTIAAPMGNTSDPPSTWRSSLHS